MSPGPLPTTLNCCTGLAVPIPTFPLASIMNGDESSVWSAIKSECPEPVFSTANFPPGVVVPMPTLPSIINPPVGAAVVSYPLPKLPPPLTLNFDPGAVSPMPTLPPVSIVRPTPPEPEASWTPPPPAAVKTRKLSSPSPPTVWYAFDAPRLRYSSEFAAESITSPLTSSSCAGLVVPMPTLPSIINPPVGAAVPAYPIPTLAPPANALSPNTESFDTGLVVPMPTLPVLSITNLSVVPSAVEDAIENLLLETSYPIVHEPAAAPENSNADFVAEYRVVRLFGSALPLPTLPFRSITNLSVVPSAVEDAIE